MEKLHSYQGWIGRFHEWRQSFGERFTNWRQENPETVIELLKKRVISKSADQDDSDYSHIYRSISIFTHHTLLTTFHLHFQNPLFRIHTFA